MRDLSPIPVSLGINGWQSIPIEENHEQLVSLQALSERIILRPFYYEMKIPTALNGAYARQGVAERLVKLTSTTKSSWASVCRSWFGKSSSA